MNDPMMSLAEAAEYLGYSVSGMRKLVERSRAAKQGVPTFRRTIEFFQDSPRSRVKFRLSWLDDYERKGTGVGFAELPTPVPKITRQNKHGLHVA